MKTVLVHKRWVYYYCCKFGIPWRGIAHDLSKFSPTEFFESVKYWTGKVSPIDICKRVNGVSKAWMHHKGRNRHHYEYWQDNFDRGGTPIQMPFKESVEMLADYLGAGQAYMGKSFSFKCEWEWWCNKRRNPLAMHPVNYHFIEETLRSLNIENSYIRRNFDNPRIVRKSLRDIYLVCERHYGKGSGIHE